MLVVHVHIEVKEDYIAEFIAATRINCEKSLREPGVARFDLVQRLDERARFLLVEAYKTPDAPTAHKETEHYLVWKKTVEHMMKSPRSSIKFESLAPEESRWETPGASAP
jgi:quinol monooxygenase YgiN